MMMMVERGLTRISLRRLQSDVTAFVEVCDRARLFEVKHILAPKFAPKELSFFKPSKVCQLMHHYG